MLELFLSLMLLLSSVCRLSVSAIIMMAFWRSAPSPSPPPTVEDENSSSSDSDSDDENAIAGIIDTRTPAIQQRPPAHGYDEYDDDTYHHNHNYYYNDTDQYSSLHQRHQYEEEYQYYNNTQPPPSQPNIPIPSTLSELHSVVERAQYKQHTRAATIEKIRRQSINVFDPIRMQQAQQYRIIHDKAPITIHRRRCLIYILIALVIIILLFILSMTLWDLNPVNDRLIDAIKRKWKKNESDEWNDRVVLLDEDDEMLRRRNDALIHGIDVIVHTDDTSPDVVKRQYHHLRYHSNGTNEDHPIEEHKELHLTDHAADGVKKLLDSVLKQENNHIRVTDTWSKEDGEQYGGVTAPAAKSDTKKSDVKKSSKPTTKPITKSDKKQEKSTTKQHDEKKQQHKVEHQQDQHQNQQEHSRDQHENQHEGQHDSHENVASHYDDTHTDRDHGRDHNRDHDYEDEHVHDHSHRSHRHSHHHDDDDYHTHHHHSHEHTSHDYEKETRERPSDDKIRDQQRARERARRGRSYSGGIILHGINNNRAEHERDFLFFLHVPLSAGTGFYQAMIKAFAPASPPQFSPSCASTPACVERMSITRVAPRYDANYLLTPTSAAMIRDPHLFRAAYNMYDIGAGHADISISSVLVRHHIHYITLLRPTVERFLSLYHTLHATTNQLRECMIAKIAELQAAREHGDGDVNKELSIAQLCDTYAHLRTTPLKANTVDELNREIQEMHLSIRRGLGDTRLTPALLLPPDVDIVRFGHLLKLMGEENYVAHMLSGTTRGSFQGTQSQRSLTDASILATAKQTLASSPFIGLTTKLNESMELFLYTFNLQLDADEWHTIMETDAYGLLTIVANSAETSKALLASPMISDVINKIEYLDSVLYEYATILFDQRYAQMLLEKAER